MVQTSEPLATVAPSFCRGQSYVDLTGSSPPNDGDDDEMDTSADRVADACTATFDSSPMHSGRRVVPTPLGVRHGDAVYSQLAHALRVEHGSPPPGGLPDDVNEWLGRDFRVFLTMVAVDAGPRIETHRDLEHAVGEALDRPTSLRFSRYLWAHVGLGDDAWWAARVERWRRAIMRAAYVISDARVEQLVRDARTRH